MNKVYGLVVTLLFLSSIARADNKCWYLSGTESLRPETQVDNGQVTSSRDLTKILSAPRRSIIATGV